MHEQGPYVNTPAGGFLRWIDSHPRLGWYIAVVVTLNLVVTVLQVFG
jgi:hypothetical protein